MLALEALEPGRELQRAAVGRGIPVGRRQLRGEKVHHMPDAFVRKG